MTTKCFKLILVAAIFLITSTAHAALTFSNLKSESAGSEKKVYGTVAFDSSYPTGGETVTLAKLNGLKSVSNFLIETKDGRVFSYDYTNNKIIVYQSGAIAAPTFTGSALATHSHNNQQNTGEALTVTAGTGVSSAAVNAPIANVESVYVTAGGVTGPFKLVPGGVTPATGEVGYNPTTGVFQFLIADAVTAATIQYIERDVTAVSAGTPAGTNSAVSAAALAQVPNTTDLSALTGIKFVAYGK